MPVACQPSTDTAGTIAVEAACLVATGRADAAVTAALAGCRAHPSHLGLRLVLAEAADAAHRDDVAAEALLDALSLCNRSLALDPLDWEMHRQKARIEYRLGLFNASCNSWARVLARVPRDAAATLGLAKASLPAGRWAGVRGVEPSEFVALVESGVATVSNLLALPVPGTSRALRAAAVATSERIAALAGNRPPCRRSIATGGPLRIGYVSPDFNDHAVAHQLVGVLEHHDRTRVEVHGYCVGHDDGSPVRFRIRSACDRFHDAASLSHRSLADSIRLDGIDILVDLAGHTLDSRLEVFALRPAPVQVSWLGYPGTTGAPFIDYLIADEIVLPDSLRPDFTEAVAYLPCPYLPADDRQPVSRSPVSRAAAMLPGDAVVLCAFHQACKIDGELVEAWMRILRAAPRTVLWIRAKSEAMQGALREAAAAAGVNPSRLAIDNHLHPKPGFIARLGLADLFLDTRWFNGHSSVSDALWAGVPVLACKGDAFQGRVAASLLFHAGLGDLVCDSIGEYADRAIALATDPGALGHVRARVAAARRGSATFDTRRSTGSIEHAFEIMADRHRRGVAPSDFRVPGPKDAR